ncbi:lysine-specific demethylase 2A-like [Thalictrum thalictroides]|uniref:Lysine-specific demethylase 2A-like n=1 Tax=Thalictrum thalictroides TaxID=46969 RepID=A0A7J6X040_THATH|nr:lysine-specific demethylase 2A-like [Thalictrum thalictroides]
MAFYCLSTPLASSTSLITTTSLLSTSSTSSSSRNYNFRSRCLSTFNLQSWNLRRGRKQIVRMAPDEEKMTRRSPLDFPIEWERPRPGRRPDIFPQFSPMKTPLPPPLPADPPEEDEEDEEKKEEEEEDPDKENPDEPEK